MLSTQDKVICQTCHSQFDMLFDDNEQAYDCAALLRHKEQKIVGYYGSCVLDGDILTPKDGEKIPEEFKEGVICDECLKRLISTNLMKSRDEDIYNDINEDEENEELMSGLDAMTKD